MTGSKKNRGLGLRICVLLLSTLGVAAGAQAACRDAVVLVHGNAGSPSDYANTWSELRSRGYAADEIFRPDWGSKACAACNDHSGSETGPVDAALVDAAARSCTGRIDVIGHSMGATLAARRIQVLGMRSYVDAFVGIAGAFRGLWSCGTYPFNVPTTTCGAQGLSVGSPLVDSLAGRRFGDYMVSIKSYNDQIVCYGGVCTVGGRHSSSMDAEDRTVTLAGYGHFGLLTLTADLQADLIE